MNCQEFKNLIDGLENLSSLGNDAEAHLRVCVSCRKLLKYEARLRQGLEEIAVTPVPAEIARKILAIPQNAAADGATTIPVWLQKIQNLLNSFSFRLAIASGITGFLFAVILIRGPVSQPPEKAAESISLSKSSTESKPENTKKRLPAIPVAPGPSTGLKMAGASTLPPAEQKIQQPVLHDLPEKAKNMVPPAAPSDTIPGAMSFSLEEKADHLTLSKEADKGQFARPPARSESSSQFGDFARAETAADESEDIPIQAQTHQGAVVAAAPYERESIPADKMPAVDAGPTSVSLSDSFAPAAESSKAESQAADPRAQQILDFLTSSGLADKEGFIDLDKLAMQGYISSRQLRDWQPPAGNGWYITRTEGRPGLHLRRKP